MKELIERLKRTEYDDLDACKAAAALERLTAELETEQGKSAKARLHEMENIRLTAERDELAKDAERVRVYKQRYFEAIAEDGYSAEQMQQAYAAGRESMQVECVSKYLANCFNVDSPSQMATLLKEIK